MRRPEEALREQALPLGSVDQRASGWWGMMGLILTEGSLFALLLFSYYYMAIQPRSAPWPTGGMPELTLALPNTLILLASSATVWWGERALRKGHRRRLAVGLAATLVLGAAFAGIQIVEWRSKPFAPFADPYSSLYFTLTGFHLAHVAAGLLVLMALLAWTLLGYFGAGRRGAVATGAIYWHFVDAVWLAVFFTLYVTPHLS